MSNISDIQDSVVLMVLGTYTEKNSNTKENPERLCLTFYETENKEHSILVARSAIEKTFNKNKVEDIVQAYIAYINDPDTVSDEFDVSWEDIKHEVFKKELDTFWYEHIRLWDSDFNITFEENVEEVRKDRINCSHAFHFSLFSDKDSFTISDLEYGELREDKFVDTGEELLPKHEIFRCEWENRTFGDDAYSIRRDMVTGRYVNEDFQNLWEPVQASGPFQELILDYLKKNPEAKYFG